MKCGRVVKFDMKLKFDNSIEVNLALVSSPLIQNSFFFFYILIYNSTITYSAHKSKFFSLIFNNTFSKKSLFKTLFFSNNDYQIGA